MASNPFDKFDNANGNPFDKFDARTAPAPSKPKREWGMSDIIKEPLKIAGEGVAGLANIPVKAAKGLYGLGTLLATGDLQRATDAIGVRNAIQSPWKSKTLEAAGENIVLPALQKTSDVTGIPMEALSGVLEAGGDIASLVGLGGGIPKTGLRMGTSPMGTAANVAGNATKITADKGASILTNLALKQKNSLSREARKQNVRTALEGGYRGTEKGTQKLNGDIAALEGVLQNELSAAQGAGVTGSLGKAIDNIEALRQNALHSSDPTKNIAAIDNAIAGLQNHPLAQNGSVGIADLQGMKVMQGRELQNKYAMGQGMDAAPDAFSDMINKARVRGLKEEILDVMDKNGFNQLADANSQLSKLYQLKKVLDPAANRFDNSSQLGGFGYKAGVGSLLANTLGFSPEVGATLGLGVGMAQSPIFAPKIASGLNKLNDAAQVTWTTPDFLNIPNAAARGGLLSGSLENAILRDNQN